MISLREQIIAENGIILVKNPKHMQNILTENTYPCGNVQCPCLDALKFGECNCKLYLQLLGE